MQLRLCQENRWRRISELLRMSASLDGVCLLHPRPPSYPPISNAKQKRSVASLPPTAHFRANLRELSSLSTRKWIGWFRKQKPQKLCSPAPCALALAPSRVCRCSVVDERGQLLGSRLFFFFLFALHQHVTQFKAGCHSALRQQSHCRRLSVACIANSETEAGDRAPV